MPDPFAGPEALDAREHRAAALVALAHESLVDARSATLLVEGVGRVGPDIAAGITLCERAGRPVLLCPAADLLADVAADGCAAVLTVPARASVDPDGTARTVDTTGTVIFLGRLQTTGTYGSGLERTAILELAPASIVVEPATRDTDDGPLEHVDLPRYTAHCRRRECCRRPQAELSPDELERVAERIRVHTNHQHAVQLVQAATRLAGRPSGTIAGARLAAVDPAGVLLDWTDETGGHRLALSFRRPAIDPASLSRSVREALEGGS